MKLTTRQLRQIIKEEIDDAMSQDESDLSAFNKYFSDESDDEVSLIGKGLKMMEDQESARQAQEMLGALLGADLKIKWYEFTYGDTEAHVYSDDESTINAIYDAVMEINKALPKNLQNPNADRQGLSFPEIINKPWDNQKHGWPALCKENGCWRFQLKLLYDDVSYDDDNDML